MVEPGTVLVTGAQGLLGRHLVALALDRWPGARIVGLGRSPQRDDAFTHSLSWLDEPVSAPLPAELRRAALHDRYSYLAQDLRDREALVQVVARVAPDVVVHAAAALRDEPWERLIAANLDAPAALVSALRTLPTRPRMVLVSSGSVYGAGDGDPPFSETACGRPMDLYGVTKRAAEDAVRVLADKGGLTVRVARVFNILGPALQERHLPAALACQVAAMVCGRRPPVLRVGPLTATRDFIDVRDAAGACLLLADADPGVYNVGSGIETPVRAVLDLVLDRTGLADRVTVHETPATRAADLPRSCADVRRLRRLGPRPAHDLATTLAQMVDYYVDSYA